jgi:hypothetical protein
VIENGARKHEPVEQRYCDTNRNALFHLPQHATGGGAMDVEIRVLAAERCRDHERLAVDRKTDVANESFIEDAIDRFAIVDSAIGFADETSPRRGHLGFRHGTNSGKRQGWMKDESTTGKKFGSQRNT